VNTLNLLRKKKKKSKLPLKGAIETPTEKIHKDEYLISLKRSLPSNTHTIDFIEKMMMIYDHVGKPHKSKGPYKVTVVRKKFKRGGKMRTMVTDLEDESKTPEEIQKLNQWQKKLREEIKGFVENDGKRFIDLKIPKADKQLYDTQKRLKEEKKKIKIIMLMM